MLMLIGISKANAQITWNCGQFTCSVPDTNVVCNTNSTCILTCTITNTTSGCCAATVNINQIIDSSFALPVGWFVTMCNPNGCFPNTTTQNAFTVPPSSTVTAKFEIHAGSNIGNADVRVKFLDVANSSNSAIFHIVNNSSATGIASIFEKKSKYLSQNFPNPFVGSTKVEYSLPTQNGKIVINDITGKQVQILSLNNAEGIVEFGNDLKSGTYFYSLYSDDKMISRNKMIVQ